MQSKLIYGLVAVSVLAATGLGVYFGFFSNKSHDPYANIRIERKASVCFDLDAPQRAAQNLLPGRSIENVMQLGCSPAYPWTDIMLYGVETDNGEHYVISADPNNRIMKVD